jgi:ABC-2 type transport system permease protein
MSTELTILYSLAIMLICIGLNAIAISLGTIFPNVNETNPAKIVSGFGGTLCLIMSFLYILSIITFLTFPVAVKLSKAGSLSTFSGVWAVGIALSLSLVLTLMVSYIPLKFALKKTSDLRSLRNL